MKKIHMKFQGKVETFQITYQFADYVFCECSTNASARGFFTTQYLQNNKVN